MGVTSKSRLACPTGKVTTELNAGVMVKSSPKTASPRSLTLTVRQVAVLPVRVIHTEPGLAVCPGQVSAARSSVATILRVGCAWIHTEEKSNQRRNRRDGFMRSSCRIESGK